ncbi:hypothetical protein CAPTEDRAFT_194044 [Capitella teleta]|uniref:Uncharacterized protein n=1 Tax=Capitella teleta TaxID=283909 RepID=R7V2L7_CAPTE|nr:hypothetical protein CAPTEDRAFT_194044 [Capitella teleta]|eukprot:ELU10576.1 hypothetical protein CAPTEDRAFT_194044 [Capitella teleta]
MEQKQRMAAIVVFASRLQVTWANCSICDPHAHFPSYWVFFICVLGAALCCCGGFLGYRFLCRDSNVHFHQWIQQIFARIFPVSNTDEESSENSTSAARSVAVASTEAETSLSTSSDHRTVNTDFRVALLNPATLEMPPEYSACCVGRSNGAFQSNTSHSSRTKSKEDWSAPPPSYDELYGRHASLKSNDDDEEVDIDV